MSESKVNVITSPSAKFCIKSPLDAIAFSVAFVPITHLGSLPSSLDITTYSDSSVTSILTPLPRTVTDISKVYPAYSNDTLFSPDANTCSASKTTSVTSKFGMLRVVPSSSVQPNSSPSILNVSPTKYVVIAGGRNTATPVILTGFISNNFEASP